MKRVLMSATLVAVLILIISAVRLYRDCSAACEHRGAAYDARVEKLRRDAEQRLYVGAKKDAVIRLFAENGIPVKFSEDEASGTIYTTGCSPFGCGSDDALLGLRVEVDRAGTVISAPAVGALYTNCL